MLSNKLPVDRETILAAYDELEAAHDKIAEMSHEVLADHELADLLNRRERMHRRHRAVDHELIARLDGASPCELGAATLPDALTQRLRISRAEARRRIGEAQDLGPRRAVTGEPLEPRLAVTAAGEARGEVSPEHVKIIRRFFNQLPSWVDHRTREQAEATLGRIACEFGPEELRAAADRLMALLDEDGEEPHDIDRARKRHLIIGRQQADGMSPIRGLLDPEARATLDAVLAKWAAPGQCNPDDETPCVDEEASEAAKERDIRSEGQRNHDGLKAVFRAMLASGQLGQHNGLPCTIIVSTTLQELESGHGHAVTGGGTLLPMSDVIRLASHAHHYLPIFDRHTEVPLYLGRTKRIASPGQRIVLHAKDRGCTHPGCTAPGYRCQAHHAVVDWANGGLTNIDDLTFACGPHNRLVEEGGWTTRKRKDGRTEWIPPSRLDTGQARVNNYHHPQRYLAEPDDDEDEDHR
jgi:hypothetical protein